MSNNYPWYTAVAGDEIEQGDILNNSPVFIPPEIFSEGEKYGIEIKRRDVVIMSQSCDLVKGREKVDEILLCPIYTPEDMKWGNKELEEARKGRLPAYHLLNSCDLAGLEAGFRIVEFRALHSLSITTVRRHANSLSKRIRLMPPYREHLSQAYARFLMRVGLPTDIPSFK